jgi:hypothetical protein
MLQSAFDSRADRWKRRNAEYENKVQAEILGKAPEDHAEIID